MSTQPEDQDYEGTYEGGQGDFDPDDIFGAPPKAINFTEEWVAGERYRLRVLERPKLIQGFDARTKKPATWPESGNPKMVGVTVVEWQGEERSLWAPKPSALFRALQAATRAAGSSVRPDGVIEIEYLGLDHKAKKPGQNAPHAFGEVTYTPASR